MDNTLSIEEIGRNLITVPEEANCSDHVSKLAMQGIPWLEGMEGFHECSTQNC
jgi:hypothetical protein